MGDDGVIRQGTVSMDQTISTDSHSVVNVHAPAYEFCLRTNGWLGFNIIGTCSNYYVDPLRLALG